jgi:hypothetical protein
MQVRMDTFSLTDQDRRAIPFVKDKRKTMCTRDEAKEFINAAVERAIRDLRYRWYGPQVSEAVLNGADPEGLASHEKPVSSEEEENTSPAEELAGASA